MTPEEETRRTMAAAEQLFEDGVYNKWFPADPRWDDTIGRADEYLAAVERSMEAYSRGRSHQEGLRLAADRLFLYGRYHIWWPRTIKSWEDEPATAQAFLTVVERMVAAYCREPLIGPQMPQQGPQP